MEEIMTALSTISSPSSPVSILVSFSLANHKSSQTSSTSLNSFSSLRESTAKLPSIKSFHVKICCDSPFEHYPTSSSSAFFKIKDMDIEMAKCECCGLKEDCTQDYITGVKENFDGKWLCGLCSEAVRDEVHRGNTKQFGVDEAVKAHMSFCRKYKSNPAIQVADGMRQMLRRRSGDMSSSNSSSKKYTRSASSTSQVGAGSSFSY